LTFGSPKNPKFYFEFRIKVFQYWLHEVTRSWKRSPEGKVITSGNWRSLEAMKGAFISYIREHQHDEIYHPKIQDLILSKGLIEDE